MKKLIGMVDFVLNQGETSTFDTDQGDWYFKEQSKLDKIRSYDNFLKQTLALWMFVPCDEDGNVLELPTKENSFNTIDHENRMIEYQQAKKRCLFEDFEMDNSFVTHKSHNSFFYPTSCLHEKTIEYLVKYNLELTPTAQI